LSQARPLSHHTDMALTVALCSSLSCFGGALLGFGLVKRLWPHLAGDKEMQPYTHTASESAVGVGVGSVRRTRLSAQTHALCKRLSGSTVTKVQGLGGCSEDHQRLLLCMVGLPARGKSYIVKMLVRYVRWNSFAVEVFNVGNIRRKEGMAGASADFFGNDASASRVREDLATACLEQAFEWLEAQSTTSFAIFDATNTTIKRRRTIVELSRQRANVTPVFIESICDDPDILSQNYAMKLSNDDYKGMDPAKASADFLRRVEEYAARYETIEDSECDGDIMYIKLFNVGQKVTMRKCSGYAISHIGFYLSNIHIQPRCIWLTQHAESIDKTRGSVNGKLTENGRRYCRALAKFLYSCRLQSSGAGERPAAPSGRYSATVLIGSSNVHLSTCVAMSSRADIEDAEDEEMREAMWAMRSYPVIETSLLNELDGGDCNGMSLERLRVDFPEVLEKRQKDKLRFRYPGAGGESYIDVIGRLEPVIIELERQRSNILVISHLAVQRCLYAYFTGCRMEEVPYLPMEMHTVYELRPMPHGTEVRSVKLSEAPI